MEKFSCVSVHASPSNDLKFERLKNLTVKFIIEAELYGNSPNIESLTVYWFSFKITKETVGSLLENTTLRQLTSSWKLKKYTVID